MSKTDLPRYTRIEDRGEMIKLFREFSDGTKDEVVVLKNMAFDNPPMTENEYQTLVHRNFDFSANRSLLFMVLGGIGDIVVAFEAIAGLKKYLKTRSRKKYEFILVMHPHRKEYLARWFKHFKLFDFQVVMGQSKVNTLYPFQTLLDCSTNRYTAVNLGIGTAWDVLWAKWGIPSRYKPCEMNPYLKTFRTAAKREHADMRKKYGYPPAGKYIFLACESNTLGEQKAWAAENWRRTVEYVLKTTDLNLVVSAAAPELREAVSIDKRVFVDDPSKTPVDFLSLASLVQNAKAVISLDTGPALIAGMLKVPCVTIWGPTSPAQLGHPNNFNLRASVCPPCFLTHKSALCADNVCMKDLRPDAVAHAIKQVLGKSFLPR